MRFKFYEIIYNKYFYQIIKYSLILKASASATLNNFNFNALDNIINQFNFI